MCVRERIVCITSIRFINFKPVMLTMCQISGICLSLVRWRNSNLYLLFYELKCVIITLEFLDAGVRDWVFFVISTCLSEGWMVIDGCALWKLSYQRSMGNMCLVSNFLLTVGRRIFLKISASNVFEHFYVGVYSCVCGESDSWRGLWWECMIIIK